MKKRLVLASMLFIMLLTIIFLARISFSHGAPVEKANWYVDYTYTLDNTKKTITVTKYNGTDTEIILPNTAKISNVTYQTIVQGAVYQNNTNLKTIIFKNGVKSGTSLVNLFRGCKNLTTLTLNNFDTSASTSMQLMFAELESLEQLDVSRLNTSNVTSMRDMFYRCLKIKSLNVSTWDTSKVTDMWATFHTMSSLESLDLSSWNTSKATSMQSMFRYNASLTELNMSGWDTSNVTNMAYMFDGLKSIENLNVSHFNTSKVTTMYRMFYDCINLKTIDLSSFDTSLVTSMLDMFTGAGSNGIKKIVIGPKTDFHDSETWGLCFGRGTWQNEQTGERIPASEICRKSAVNAAGSYIKLSNVSELMVPKVSVDYIINSEFGEFDFYTEYPNVFKKSTNLETSHPIVIAKDALTTTEQRNIPGSFDVIFKDQVTDINGELYDLKITIDNIKIYDTAILTDHPNVIYSIFDVLRSNILRFVAYTYPGDESLVNPSTIAINEKKTSRSYDAVLTIQDKQGNKKDGTFLFSAYDLDVYSWRDGNDTPPGYGNYSEGVNLLSGFDLNTITVLPNTALQRIGNNRLTGSKSDGDTEYSEFVVKANSGAKFTWTMGNSGGTGFLSYYQPQIVELEKVDNHNNKVEGVELSLYNSDNELVESWTTTNENKKLFLMPGMYILKETTNPNTNKYQTSEDITFFVDINDTLTINNQSVEKITMTNTIKKYSYVVNYFDQDGNVIRAQKVSDPLEYGTTITSSTEIIDIPYWEYDRVDKDSITIQEGTNVINIYYKRPLYTLSINKVNNQGEALEGAEFALYNEIEPSGTLDKDMMLDIYNGRSYYLQENIIKIITTNHINIPSNAEDYWDVSVEQDGSVMAWTIVDNQTGYIELYIGQTGGVKTGYDNVGLFANLPMVEEIDLSYFHIDENSDISYMFEHDGNLKTIYVSDLWKYESSLITNVFNDCVSIIGGNGTSFMGADALLARVDTVEEPGYFTYKNVSTIAESQTGLSFSLQPGVYQLKETKAPSGYKLDLNTYTVNVAEDGTITIDGKEVVQDEDNSKLYHVDMVNELMPNMPLTGGKGIIAFIITGLSLFLIGVTGYYFNRNKKTSH